ncbi:hypothetical protein LWI29_025415 [Acer saccharum]|uniref:Uncharacterized protein n=1 Tax=Acer saccharum TaxID=4024 RepID=A0AA39RNF2_ACESA|nr:hypothetical protein LWI29_025415 [Acer saccharum]
MEKLAKRVSMFSNGPLQAHVLVDVHHMRFEMAERGPYLLLAAANENLVKQIVNKCQGLPLALKSDWSFVKGTT